MNFSEKLRTLRKNFKLSQEQLAEKIGVSRQAITKWETEGGLPDIENMMAIASLFSVSIDELLSGEKLTYAEAKLAYESVTEYDISRPCHFDIHAPGALEINIKAAADEKLRICLSSNILQTIAKDYKVQIDEHRDRIDVDIRRQEQANDLAGKEALYISICLPAALCHKVELTAITQALRLIGTEFPFELDGKSARVILEGAKDHITLNCNIDMDIKALQLPEVIELNQINASSALHIPKNASYYTKIKGKSNRIIFAKDGKPFEYQGDPDASNRIELAGMNAELLIEHDI